MDNDEFSAIRAAGYTDQQLADIRLAIAVTTLSSIATAPLLCGVP
jgi:hypothetical protein